MTLEEVINESGQLLSSEIDRNCCLLDIPNHFNVGDHLIYAGELAFFSKFSNQKIEYTCSRNFFNKSKIKKDHIILLHGGGNFGDVWKKHQLFREEIISNFKENKIILFSSTVFFQTRENLEKCVSIFSSHPNLVLCARDKKSEDFLRANFIKNKVLLIPDMALFLPAIKRTLLEHPKNILLIQRNDREQKEFSYKKLDVEVGDWHGYEYGVFKPIHMFVLGLNLVIDKILPFAFLDRYGLIPLNYYQWVISRGVIKLSHYRIVVSTRLHGFILSYLMRIPCILLDNSYGKNSSFFNTWFVESIDGYSFAQSESELVQQLNSISNEK